jgi:hypothetical protein
VKSFVVRGSGLRGRFGLPFGALVMACGLAGAGVAGVACSSSDDGSPAAAPDGDGGGAGEGGVPPGAGDAGEDAGGGDAGADGAAACEGNCRVTTLVANLDGNGASFADGHFGLETDDAGAPRLYVEVSGGGNDDVCPTESSPTPGYTFVLAGTPRGGAGASFTEADGVKASFLDFEGTLLPSTPVTKSTAATVTITAIDPAAQPAWLAFDVTSTFPEGKVSGHVYATYCASLSLP